MNKLSKDYKVPEEELPLFVAWPDKKFEASEVREIFARVNRFVDFDKTIAKNGRTPRTTLRGRSSVEFLAEEPYIVQTWNDTGAIRFFTKLYPEFPKPVLIILVPAFSFVSPDGYEDFGKNFSALGISGKTIIDDFLAEEIHAPSCIVLQPDL